MDGFVGLLLVIGIVFAIAKYLQAGARAARPGPGTGWLAPSGIAGWQAPRSEPAMWTPPGEAAVSSEPPVAWGVPAPPAGTPTPTAPIVSAAPDPALLARLDALERAVHDLAARHDATTAELVRVAVALRDARSGTAVPGDGSPAASGDPDAGSTSPVLAEVRRLLAEGRKIEAIKVYREATGVGLAEAKDVVEAFEGGLPD